MNFSLENIPIEVDTLEKPWELRVLETEFTKLKPYLDEFFYEVIQNKPDVLIFLDKGARMLARPFKKFISKLVDIEQSNYHPEIIFWNNDSYKHDAKKIKKLYTESKFTNKKIFFIDETVDRGSFAITLKDFLKKEDINADYFAFTHTDNSDLFKLQQDLSHKFHFYPVPIGNTLIIKELAELIVEDSETEGTIVSRATPNSRKNSELITSAYEIIDNSLKDLTVEKYLIQKSQVLLDRKNEQFQNQ